MTLGIGDGCVVTGALNDYVVDWAFQGFHRRDAGFMRSLSLLHPGCGAVDIGANIGIWTMLAASRVGADGQVLAVEPMPGTYEQLQDNVRANRFAQVTCERYALSESAGPTVMFGDDVSAGVARFASGRRNSGAAGLAPLPGVADTHVDVQAHLLDDVVGVPGIPRIAVVKIDVEGAELGVLRGATELLASPSPPAIFVEMDPNLMRRFGAKPSDVLSLLDEFGYRVFRFNGTKWQGVDADVEWVGHGDALALPPHALRE